jgi:muramoyltetrapeptide carboxypeptidase LdcA involved in peptidoglycan recycling
MSSPAEVLSGVPYDQAKRAIALLRDAWIHVNVRPVKEGRWLYVAAVDEKRALELLAANRFPPPMAIAHERGGARPATSAAAPGDDVWALLRGEETPWPSVYSFP